jgi:hypothetical protein
MPAVRENRSTAASLPDLVDLAPYRTGRGGHLPDDLDPDVHALLKNLSAALSEHPPRKTDAVVAYTPVSWAKKPERLELHALGDYQSEYDGITVLAKSVKHVQDRFGVYPSKKPISGEQWRFYVETNANRLGRLRRRGILIYSR